jgi:Protein of unknown function (DUF2950)
MIGRFYTICAALAFVYAGPSFAQERFDSPDAAAEAVIQAAGAHDTAKLSALFGPSAKNILTCGNAEQDRSEQTEFATEAQAKHRIQVSQADPNRAVLSIGDDDWPFPVPIVRANGKWSFDASAAPVEMRARRIGTDELDAEEICRGYVEAQRNYASEYRDKNGMLQYAQHIMSTPGHHDGLYWEGAAQPLVPARFAQAAWDGGGNTGLKPYHGYYFKVLEAQGPDAPGGAHSYVFKNKLIGGFGLVAWPAEYGVSGIHTFIVNQTGQIYQKDIPPVSAKVGSPITRYDPDNSWQPVE